MAHQPPLCEFIPRFRCPRCDGKPLLKEYHRRRVGVCKVRYMRCRRCPYRTKVIAPPPAAVNAAH